MRTILYCFVILIALFVVFAEPVAAQVAAKVVVVGVSDRFKSGVGEPTHGIPNVGIGAKVVLKPFVLVGSNTWDRKRNNGAVATSATWTLTSKPEASTLALDATPFTDTVAAGNNNLVVYFTPDVAGEYVVSMTATADSVVGGPAGSGAATVTITAGRFAGVGMYNPNSQSYANLKCASGCHVEVTTYVKTNHASAFQRKVDTDGGHFNSSCIRCHSASTSVGGDNGGFDEYATALGFVVDTNYSGQYMSWYAQAGLGTPHADSLAQLLSLTGIQCESCHGPAQAHLDDPNKVIKPSARLSSDVCAPCHFSSDRHPKGYSWDNSLHAKSVGEPDYPNHMNSGSCARCHTGQGFVEFVKTGQTASFYENPEPIGCSACHDPHDQTGKEFQLRRGTVADACTGCHTTRISSRGLHHSHQGQMIQGVNTGKTTLDVISDGGVQDVAGFELPGYNYENSAHSDIEVLCVQCHMAPSPDFDPTYSSPDTLVNKLGGHSWAIRWDAGTPDIPSDDIINDTGCKSCHATGLIPPITLAFVEATQHEITSLLDTLKAYLPLTSGTDPEPKWGNDLPTSIQKAASYNYYFVANDLSKGVHNFKYAKALLESSIEQVKLTAGAADITSIKDVPNDQGGYVQVVWNKFPAEGFSFNAVVNYGVWRQDPVYGTKVTPKKNHTEMIQTGVLGQSYSIAGMVWTYVANVPASKLAQYSYIAPTLKNGSASDSTLFYIAGYSVNNMHVYSSLPFAGFSIDDIIPTKVINFTVSVGVSGATLTWKPDPKDHPDTEKFFIYRGTTKTFSADASNKIAETTSLTYLDAAAASGTPYWYHVRAVDNSGNLGELADEPMGTTNVEQTEGLPTTYALGQNFPNPFNPSTTITFSLPEAGTVVLSVYTISGELVKRLAQGEFPAGNFKATWTGTDENGAQVATGMYLYRIQSGTFTSVKKMIMLK